MGVFSCCGNTLKTLSRSAAKSASARLRQLGLLTESADWMQREAICRRCPMAVFANGVLNCGKPYLRKPVRTSTIDGCGCPCREKARDPAEHCPIDAHHRPARHGAAGCTCRWCAAGN